MKILVAGGAGFSPICYWIFWIIGPETRSCGAVLYGNWKAFGAGFISPFFSCDSKVTESKFNPRADVSGSGR
jgi:hypothetical protein